MRANLNWYPRRAGIGKARQGKARQGKARQMVYFKKPHYMGT